MAALAARRQERQGFMSNSIVGIAVFAGIAILVIMMIMAGLANLYRKAGPHEALVVYGIGGTRIIKGHGAMILPVVQTCRLLSLELMSFDVAPDKDLYTRQGVAVNVEAVAQIKVKSDPESIQTAAEQFLTKTPRRTRRADPTCDGRPSARHYRAAYGGRDCEGAGDGGRPYAFHQYERHGEDGARSDFVHYQRSSR